MRDLAGRRVGALGVGLIFVGALLLGGCGVLTDDDASPGCEVAVPPQRATSTTIPPASLSLIYELPFRRFEGAVVTDMTYGDAGLDRWRDEVPGIADVRISSRVDGSAQPALWLAHDRDEPRPLLVVLHSWGADYQQHFGIPYARWASDNGWAMIHPDFRGSSDGPEPAGSDCAIEDVLDAIEFATANAAIAPGQVVVVGYSSGGMQALDLVGRHPDRFAGVVAWVPIYDLAEWYGYAPGWVYAGEIVEACGGDPISEAEAAVECRERSPSAHLDAARRADVPIFIGVGISDPIVPPVHGAWAFNHLADPDDRLDEEALASIAGGVVPPSLAGEVSADPHFHDPDPPVLFARQSGNVTLVIFQGGHLAVYNPGLEWLVEGRNVGTQSE